jgi:hypothetical protein
MAGPGVTEASVCWRSLDVGWLVRPAAAHAPWLMRGGCWPRVAAHARGVNRASRFQWRDVVHLSLRRSKIEHMSAPFAFKITRQWPILGMDTTEYGASTKANHRKRWGAKPRALTPPRERAAGLPKALPQAASSAGSQEWNGASPRCLVRRRWPLRNPDRRHSRVGSLIWKPARAAFRMSSYGRTATDRPF